MKDKKIELILFAILVILIIIMIICLIIKPNDTKETISNNTKTSDSENQQQENINTENSNTNISNNNETTETSSNINNNKLEWNLRLVNKENPLPEDFTVELASIDETRKFDKRAIDYLQKMINDMRVQGAPNIWAQSTYRSIEYQKNTYDKSVQEYIAQGKTKQEAEKLTDEYIQKPGTSEHNLGLAVDFNNAKESFEKTKEFKWLQENASKYGFILRYPKEKENITGIKYEPWHWRYVGQEHAEKIKSQNLCLEEYVQGKTRV